MKHGLFSIAAGDTRRTYDTLLKQATSKKLARRIMMREAAVFSTQPKLKALIANRLGWVDVASKMQKQVDLIEKFGNKALADGIRHVVLIGMGGSSLCPELFGLVFGKHPKLKSYHVLDSTDPIAVAAVDTKIDLKKSLFIVASKSGGTVETRSHEGYFLMRLKQEQIKNPGRHFAAITDKGSELEKFARKNKYRQVFVNPSDIGGRYSALSFFGLVPAFFAGVNLRRLLDTAVEYQRLLKEREGELNPSLALGTLLGAAWKGKRDKLTFVASTKGAPLVPWIEQLVAESTGKQGRGIVPIENEPVLPAGRYGRDRLFVFIRMYGEGEQHRSLKQSLLRGKVPVVEIVLESPYDLAGQFLIWELATAVAGWHLKINPFDEPNVTESKENTKKILAGFQRIGKMPLGDPHAIHGHLALLLDDKSKKYTVKKSGSLGTLIGKFLKHAGVPQYVSILNYFDFDAQTERALAEIRRGIATRHKVATLRGYGPRFLHSIGQLYKGGPSTGMFIVLVRNQYASLPIPGQPFDFGQLITAQAIGDTQALVSRKLPVLLIGVDGLPSRALRELHMLIRYSR